jgi:hypothetical protein
MSLEVGVRTAVRTLGPAQEVVAVEASLHTRVPARVVPEPVTPKTKLPVGPVVTPVTSRLKAAVIGPVSVLGAVIVTTRGVVTAKQPVHVLA